MLLCGGVLPRPGCVLARTPALVTTRASCRGVARAGRCGAVPAWRAAVAPPRRAQLTLCCAAGGDGADAAPPQPPPSPAGIARRAWGVAWRLLRRFWRPLLLAYACLTFNLPLLLFWAANRQAPVRADLPVRKSDEEWRAALSPAAYHVLIERGTESSFSSPLEHEKRAGSYGCAGCGAPLFASASKFDSGTGWPSYFEALPGAVEQTIQPLYCLGDFGARECRCARCGSHLGHVFTDGPKPTGLRYCMNGVALAFSAAGGDA